MGEGELPQAEGEEERGGVWRDGGERPEGGVAKNLRGVRTGGGHEQGWEDSNGRQGEAPRRAGPGRLRARGEGLAVEAGGGVGTDVKGGSAGGTVGEANPNKTSAFY